MFDNTISKNNNCQGLSTSVNRCVGTNRIATHVLRTDQVVSVPYKQPPSAVPAFMFLTN